MGKTNVHNTSNLVAVNMYQNKIRKSNCNKMIKLNDA